MDLLMPLSPISTHCNYNNNLTASTYWTLTNVPGAVLKSLSVFISLWNSK